jgi:hypothetical protein
MEQRQRRITGASFFTIMLKQMVCPVAFMQSTQLVSRGTVRDLRGIDGAK